MLKTIEAFKVGEHTDSAGNKKEWTAEEAQFITKYYNEMLAKDPSMIAPICKGHPTDNAPAYGWVKSLSFNNNIVEATIDFNDSMVEEIKDGQFKKVSIALYDDLLLRHIGMLGAAAPAVKGLQPVEFKERKEDYTEWTFSEEVEPPKVKDSKELLFEREVKYGIGRKDNIGYIDKPTAYKDVIDEDFADPVNYLFPINDEENFIASYQTFNNYETRERYSQIEQQVIKTRLLKGLKKYNIDAKEDARLYRFSENSNQFTGIQLNDKLKRDKPAIYENYVEADFADPVHFRFPIKNRNQILSSIALVHKDNNVKEYSENDMNIIRARIINNAMAIGINLNGDNWNYSETNNINLKFNKEFNMNEWLEALKAFAIKWVGSNVSEEIASEFQAGLGTYITENPIPSATAKPEEEKPQFSENEKAMMNKIEVLEKRNRINEYSNFAEKLVVEGKILPAERDNLILTLEAVHSTPNKIEFSESDKTQSLTPVEALKNMFNSRPAIHKLDVEISKDGKGEDEGLSFNDKLNNKVIEYRKEMAKAGNNLTFAEALNIVLNQDKGE